MDTYPVGLSQVYFNQQAEAACSGMDVKTQSVLMSPRETEKPFPSYTVTITI